MVQNMKTYLRGDALSELKNADETLQFLWRDATKLVVMRCAVDVRHVRVRCVLLTQVRVVLTHRHEEVRPRHRVGLTFEPKKNILTDF